MRFYLSTASRQIDSLKNKLWCVYRQQSLRLWTNGNMTQRWKEKKREKIKKMIKIRGLFQSPLLHFVSHFQSKLTAGLSSVDFFIFIFLLCFKTEDKVVICTR